MFLRCYSVEISMKSSVLLSLLTTTAALATVLLLTQIVSEDQTEVVLGGELSLDLDSSAKSVVKAHENDVKKEVDPAAPIEPWMAAYDVSFHILQCSSLLHQKSSSDASYYVRALDRRSLKFVFFIV